MHRELCPKCSSESTQSVAILLAWSSAQEINDGPAAKYILGCRPGIFMPWLTIGVGLYLLSLTLAAPVRLWVNGLDAVSIIMVLLGPFVLGFGYFWKFLAARRQRKWDFLRRYHQKLWLCYRCGSDWIPDSGVHKELAMEKELLKI